MSSESIRVLLVEDNMGDAGLLYAGLEEALPGQFQMTHVKRLSEALEFLWKETCDVVLLDLGLPDSHGIDTLILTRAQAPEVPIVVLTGFQDDLLGEQALKEGAQDYLIKGQVESRLLARSMRYAIARKAVAEALFGREVALAKAGMLRQSRQRLITAHERVRRDIAGQLQGGVEEGLIALRGRLREFLCGFDTASEPARHLGGVIERLSESITKQVAVLGRQLYPSSLNEGIVAAFQCFRDQFGASLDIEIEPDEQLVKNERADGDYLPEQVRLAAYRIAEEALTNAVKRANASMVTVRLDSSREGWLCMTVRDGGHNLDAAATSIEPEMGTMQDYAEAVDGQSSVRSESGVGTEVTAVLPLSRPETEHPLSSEKGGK